MRSDHQSASESPNTGTKSSRGPQVGRLCRAIRLTDKARNLLHPATSATDTSKITQDGPKRTGGLSRDTLLQQQAEAMFNWEIRGRKNDRSTEAPRP